jgi:hypothetical protein
MTQDTLTKNRRTQLQYEQRSFNRTYRTKGGTMPKPNKITFEYDPITRTGFLKYANGTKTFYAGPIRLVVKELWIAMCKHDKIDPTASFVVFSNDNPIQPLYQQAMNAWNR